MQSIGIHPLILPSTSHEFGGSGCIWILHALKKMEISHLQEKKRGKQKTTSTYIFKSAQFFGKASHLRVYPVASARVDRYGVGAVPVAGRQWYPWAPWGKSGIWCQRCGGWFSSKLCRETISFFLKKSSFEWPLILLQLNYALSFRWNMVELITQKYFQVTFWMPGFRDAPDPYLLMSGSVAG